MSAKKYFGAFCLYLNYLVHGIGVLVMSLNVHEFEVQWQTDAAGVSVVISSLGLGRLALLVLAGSLSDKYGRRPFVLLGTVTYLAFFIGLLFTHDVGTAYFFGLLAGAANSLLYAGTYPRLMELFPKAPGPAVILVKAFVAAGQFSLPLILSFLVAHELWFGWSLLIAAAILALNFCVLFWMPIKVPDQPTRLGEPLAAELAQLNDPEAKLKLKRSSRIAMPELISYTLFGYTAMATFYIVSQWLAQYGESVAGMPYSEALKLLSIYTTGSLAGVFCSSLALRTFLSPQMMLLGCTTVSTLALAVACFFPSPTVMFGFSFIFGFAAAGGVVQLGLAMMAAQFPRARGRATGIYYSAGSISNFTMPLITAWIVREWSIHEIFKFDVIISGCGILLAVFIAWRSRHAQAIDLN